MQNIQYTSLSETAVLLSLDNTINVQLHHQIILLKHLIELNPFKGFIETVPAYNSIAVYYNPIEVEQQQPSIADAVIEKLKKIVQTGDQPIKKTDEVNIITIPVCYDEEYGIDLPELSVQLYLSVKEIIHLHTKPIYTIYMIGFTPGFPYMGIVDEKLYTQRKPQPRLQVPAGSVAIAGNQTGIYPLATPGGWNIIGRSALKIFDQQKENPFLLNAGDQIQFTAVTKKEFTMLISN